MASSVKEWIAQLADDKPAEAFKAYRRIEIAATRATAPGKESDRAEIAGVLAAELNAMNEPGKDKKGNEKPPEPKYPPQVRGKICQLLAYVGGGKEVSALVKAMETLEIRETARCSLDANTSEEAADALVKALDEIGAEFRLGVVNSLGKRGGPKAIDALRKAAADDKDPAVRIAAVEALAGIPDAAHADVVLKAAQCAQSCSATRAWKAAVRLAESLRKAGMKSQAADLYRKVEAEGPEPQKAAAKIGLEAVG